MAKLLLLNGPNLNLLGSREPAIYGHETLRDIEETLRAKAEGQGHQFWCAQSNSEGGLVDWLQTHRDADFLLINAGAYTHTSVALRDAIKQTGMPFIEIHISNVHQREPFRHHSFLSDIATGLIVGLGTMGYSLALDYALEQLSRRGTQ